MRKLKLQMQISIDGFAAGPNGEQDWVFLPGKQDPAALQSTLELAQSCDTLLLGRKIINEFTQYWENVADNQPDNPWNSFARILTYMRKIAFSRTQTNGSGRNLQMENGDLATVVQELKKQPGKDLLVYGGVELVSSLISENLIDEYYLIVNPVAIGTGLSIFKDRKIMQLESTITYKNGKVLNKYLPV